MKPMPLAVAATLLLLGLVDPATANPVTWTFIETSCTSNNGGCTGFEFPPLPAAVATLTLPTIDSSGSYHFFASPLSPPVETGDLDFLLTWSDGFVPPIAPVPSNNRCRQIPPVTDTCSWNISFASSATGLSISVEFGEGTFASNISLETDGIGSIGSDAEMYGCGQFAECSIAGIWELVGVPEPGALAVLVIALFVLGLTTGSIPMGFSRGKNETSQRAGRPPQLRKAVAFAIIHQAFSRR